MRLRSILEDDDAVSPVIGVILMVAITVILAAVIASFVLGLGPSGDNQPTASFEFDYTNSSDSVDVTHGNGDKIKDTNLYVRGDFDDSTSASVDSNGDWDSLGGSASGEIGGDSAVSSGDSVTLTVGSGYDLKVVWDTDDGSATLSDDSGPDA